MAEEPKITSVSRVKKPKSITNETQTRNPIDINDLVDFSYAGYDYGNDIPNLTCDVDIDLSHKKCYLYTIWDQYVPSCPDVRMDLQTAIDDYPGKTICLSKGLYRIDGKIFIDSDNTVLRGHSEGTHLYFKGPNLSDLDYAQHFGGDCSKYNDMENMCNSISNCQHNGSECEDVGFGVGIRVNGGNDGANQTTHNIVKEEELHSNTINVATIGTGDNKLKCGDEILIQVIMTQEFIDEYEMNDWTDGGVWTLGETHIMFRRRIMKPPEAHPNLSTVEDEETGRTESLPRKLKPRYYKLTLDIPIRHKIDLKYSPFVVKKLNPYLKNVGLEDLFISDAIPYDYSQRKFKPYEDGNSYANNSTIAFTQVKNGWIKNVNSFTPTLTQEDPHQSVMQYLYGVDYETEVGGMKITEAPMKANITNVFCTLVKAKFALDADDYWGSRVCDVAHNASIWTELNLLVSTLQQDNFDTNLYLEGEQHLFFSNPGQECKQMKKQSLNDNYGDMYLNHLQGGGFGGDFGVPSMAELNHMSGHPPPLVTFGDTGDGDRPFRSIEHMHDINSDNFDNKKAKIVYDIGGGGADIRQFFLDRNIPENTDITELGLQLRFHNERYPSPDTIADDIEGTTYGWHNCGWKRQYGETADDSEAYSCWTYQIERWIYIPQQDYGEIHFKNHNDNLLHSKNYDTYDDTDNDYVPENINIVQSPQDFGNYYHTRNYIRFDISAGGTTDCSGVCRPNEIRVNPDNGEVHHNLQFCDGYNEFDSSCCICDELLELPGYEDSAQSFPVNYCDPPLWLGGKGNDDFADSRPVWMDYFFETYYSTNLPNSNLDESGQSVDEPTDEHSVIKEFDNLMNGIGNPSNVPSIKEEPKHLLSHGFSLVNNRNITIKDCTLKLPQSKGPSGRGYLFNIAKGNNDILIQDCEGYRGRHNFLSGGVFSNSNIVHDRVKSSGGWLWLNQSHNGDKLNPDMNYQYTDDEWWSRYQELEVVGFGKPGYSDNHVGLTFGSLYTDSEIFDGIAWHNRQELSSGAGQTTVNSTLWNIKGYDEIPDNNWQNMSIPGMSLIQSFNFGEGLIYQPYYETNSNFIYDTDTDVDEEVKTYIDYLEGMVNPYDYDFETGFGQAYGLLSVLGQTLVDSLVKNFRVRDMSINLEQLRELGFPVPDFMGGSLGLDIKFDLDKTEVSTEYNEQEDVLLISVEGRFIINFQSDLVVDYVPHYYSKKDGKAFSRNFTYEIGMNFNNNTVTVNTTTSGTLITDIDFDGGWFPFREIMDANLEDLINFGKCTILGIISVNIEGYDGITWNDISQQIKKYLSVDVIPARLKYYTFGGVETIFPELVNPNIKEASGLAHSRQFANVFWAHNDSTPEGETPNVIYAFNQDGGHLGKLIISPTINQRDWEDMAYDGQHLYIGEIGDNNKVHEEYYVYKCIELNPNGGDLTTTCEEFPFTYPDEEKFDAETLMVDSNGDIYIITKGDLDDTSSKIFLLNTEAGTADYVMDIELNEGLTALHNLITGGDINGDGSKMIIRTYENIYIYEKSGNGVSAIQNAIADGYTIGEYNREPYEQGEAVTISNTFPFDDGYYTISEENSPLGEIFKQIKDFFSTGGDFFFGDRRKGTEPSDEFRVLDDAELTADNYQSSLYNKQLDERLSLPISEDITIPQCGGQEEEQEEEELEPDLIPGCMDINACNYKSWATTADDSCLYPSDFPHRCYEDLDDDIGYESPIMIYWCDDKLHLTTNPKKCEDCQTNTLDCFKKTISGTEETSDDYRSPGNQGFVYGCMDYTACNYDDGATADDGTCYYGPMNDGYNEEGYNCADVYFVKEFMSVNDNTIRYYGQDVDFTFEPSGGNFGFASGPNGELGDGYCGVANFCAKFENGNLKTFKFANGALNGFIPESIGFATELEQLDLSNNAYDVDGAGNDYYVAGTFVADLPDSIGNLTNLTRLKVGGNRYGQIYSEGIPESIGNLRNLEQLDMQAIGNYKLKGTIPESMRNLRNLEQVRLQKNSLEGEIPDIFYGMSNLNVLELSYNNLEGFLPNSICEINPQEMGIFYLASNKLCPPPPPDCITEDDIHFHTQEYNEDCYIAIVPDEFVE